ncbi:MAG: tetratricopeptide repeat protein [Spirochaetales bacterium]|nr:tetratricopeptide repeat protein [Spirochaetales bacterium]
MKTKTALSILFFIVLAAGIGCQSTINPHEEDVTGEKLFQLAYEETDNQNYDKALSYYRVFQERFPEDITGNLWATYEIAFLYHKKGNDNKALDLFNELLRRYEEEDGAQLPQAPRILAEKVIQNIKNDE